ncbi:MAG: DUF3553 domain-containing protein [Planctomycetota bacterium]
MASTQFQFGDRVMHASRPEWGEGIVTAVANATHDGAACQRLTVRFERAGLKTVSTGVADIRNADEVGPAAADDASGPAPWLEVASAEDVPKHMAKLPDATRDPFTTLEDRLTSTLHLYRFSDQGGSLLDWAAMQTGLADPLTHFSRHELEAFFKRFAFERDQHLKRVLAEVRKTDASMIARVAAAAPLEARNALQRVHIGR